MPDTLRVDAARSTTEYDFVEVVTDTNQVIATIRRPKVGSRDDNRNSLIAKATAAQTNNRAFIQQAKPGTAAQQASQAYDQAVALSRQMNAIFKLVLDDVTDTTGT